MSSLDDALENHMSRFGVRIKKPVIDDGPAIPVRSVPTIMVDGSGDLIRAITACEAAFAELRRALVTSSEPLPPFRKSN